MKILMVSVFHYHSFNWMLQLKGTDHEVFWMDVNDSNTYVKKIDFVNQIVKWKIKIDYPGRYRLRQISPFLDCVINKVNNRKFLTVFKEKLQEIQPDVVQSFELHSAGIPILEIMKQYPKIKWIYSAWGSDMYFFQNNINKLKKIKETLPHIDYMFADCQRDFSIAKLNGFRGTYLGTFPGAGGYDLGSTKSFLTKIECRNIILIKGYQGKFGRCIEVLKAILKVKDQISDFRIIVFAADKIVLDFISKTKSMKMSNLDVKGRLGGEELLRLMGKSIIYIGNSISDGMPNTLLESIIMETFPIQSNPGGATAELIQHGRNGFLIDNPKDSDEIAMWIKEAINDRDFMQEAIRYNTINIKPNLERNCIKKKVLKKYRQVEHTLNENNK